MIILIVAVMILNQNWLITSVAIFISFAAWCLYLVFCLKLYVGVIAPQFALMIAVLSIMTYFMELKYKSEFLQNKKNKTMKQDFRHMLEVMPEAILIYDPSTKELSYANDELQRLAAKYGKHQIKSLGHD